MAAKTQNQLQQLQQTLYDKAYKEAHAIVSGTSATILAYSAKFEQSLPKRCVRTNQTELLAAMRQHRFILYGDFHTLRQSQRGLLRLLRTYVERQRTKKVVLALEMFKCVDQDLIDGYLAGRLSDEVFLGSVNYSVEWGFPWQNFKMILDFARARKLQVAGINTENAGRDTLLKRDRFAAKCLVSLAKSYPDHKIICLIGEYHLADAHLPKALAAEQECQGVKGAMLRILNNIDRYYFALNKANAPTLTEYLRLRKDYYCVVNSPPWMKWQSFSLWEETRHISSLPASDQEYELNQKLDLYSEDAFDVDYQFMSFVKNIAAFMSLPIDPSDMESFQLQFSPGGDFFRDLAANGILDVAEAKRLVGRASVDGVYFIGKTKSVLLTYISINNLAEAAGQYLHTLLTGFQDCSGVQVEDFYRRVLKSAVGMIASKILNPSRQCMELHHFRQVLLRTKKAQDLPADSKMQLATAVLRFDLWIGSKLHEETLKMPAPQAMVLQLDQDLDYAVSRSIGQMLGYSLCKKVIVHKVPSARIRRLFKKKIGNGDILWREISALYRLMVGR